MTVARVVKCRSCGAEIVFLRTATGKLNPVNADTVEAHDEIYEHGRHVSHFSTCANADAHRRSQR
jgi:hypothetical protein